MASVVLVVAAALALLSPVALLVADLADDWQASRSLPGSVDQ